jgi:hypothetical protein
VPFSNIGQLCGIKNILLSLADKPMIKSPCE